MTEPNSDDMAGALRRFRERVGIFCEQSGIDAENPGTAREPGYWESVIVQEAAYLAEEGPAAYLRYVARLDDAAVRADLDRHLRLIHGEGGEP